MSGVEDAPKWFLEFHKEFTTTSLNLTNRLEKIEGKLNEIDNVKHTADAALGKANQNELELESLKKENKMLQETLDKVKTRMIFQEINTRKNNLVFQGITDEPRESWTTTEKKIADVFKNYKFPDSESIFIDKAQRIGNFAPGKTRPVVVTLNRFKDKEKIWSQRSLLKKSNIWISEDYPKEIIATRRTLFPILRAAQKEIKDKPDGEIKKVTLNLDKILINGVAYKEHDLHKLPNHLKPENLATKTHENTTVFFSKESVFSNFYMHAPFQMENDTFLCTEQYFQFKKAMLFNDQIKARKIMNAEDPFVMKDLGKKVENYVKEDWMKHAITYLKQANEAKFCQNQAAKEALIRTGVSTLGEATMDPVWGIGLKLTSPDVTNTESWTGENHFGKILMEIRDTFTKQ